MALVVCYSPDGEQHEVEMVDFRECQEHCGYTLKPPEEVKKRPYTRRGNTFEPKAIDGADS